VSFAILLQMYSDPTDTSATPPRAHKELWELGHLPPRQQATTANATNASTKSCQAEPVIAAAAITLRTTITSCGGAKGQRRTVMRWRGYARLEVMRWHSG